MRTKSFIRFEPSIEDGSNDPRYGGNLDGEKEGEDNQLAANCEEGEGTPRTWTHAWLAGAAEER